MTPVSYSSSRRRGQAVSHHSSCRSTSSLSALSKDSEYHLLPRLYIGEPSRLVTLSSFSDIDIPQPAPSVLRPQAILTLSEEQSHYLTTVLRLFRKKESAMVRLFDSVSGEWLAQVEATDTGRRRKGPVIAHCQQQLRPPATSSIFPILAIAAPKKKERLRWMMEKATELNVGSILLLESDFAEAVALPLDKLFAYLVEAAEQSERLDLPHLIRIGESDDTVTTQLYDFLGQTNVNILACRERSDALPLFKALDNKNDKAAFCIGPEGGWSAEEESHMDSLEWVQSVSLGPNVLRAETAAITCMAAFTLFQDGKG